MKFMNIKLIITALFTTFFFTMSAYGAEDIKSTDTIKSIKLLTIGNSFADNVLHQLPQIVKASGNKLVYGKANLGGASFYRHCKHLIAYEKNHDDPKGKPYLHGKFSLKDMLTQQSWDVITIQQVSYRSHNLKSYEPHAAKVYAYIKKCAPQAKVYLHQVWAYRIDDPRFTAGAVHPGIKNTPTTQKAMYEQVRQCNHTIAEKLAIDILPSGDAMYLADTDPKWGYKPDLAFDLKSAKYPNLPGQTHSLHRGRYWRWQKDGSKKMRMDGHHASSAGEYLVACVWFEILYGENIINNSYVPQGMDKKYAAFLRKTAHDVAQKQLTNKL